jgi:hypothetical protein
MAYQHLYCATVAANHRAYAISGENTTSVESFNLRSNKWESCPPISTQRKSSTATNFDDKFLFVVGGFDGEVRLRSIEKFNIETSAWILVNVLLPHAGTNFLVS